MPVGRAGSSGITWIRRRSTRFPCSHGRLGEHAGKLRIVRHAAVFVVAGVVGALLAAPATMSARPNELIAEVPRFRQPDDISIHRVTGSRLPIPRLRRGTYIFYVFDRSPADNFHIVGPRLNKKTRVHFVGSTQWRLTLRPGRYVYYSDTRPQRLRRELRVYR